MARNISKRIRRYYRIKFTIYSKQIGVKNSEKVEFEGYDQEAAYNKLDWLQERCSKGYSYYMQSEDTWAVK